MTKPTFTWSRYGGYECSSRGNRVFSAFTARLPQDAPYKGRTIEQVYQCDVKGYDIGGTNWRKGKGKAPHPEYGAPADQLWECYFLLWKVWADDHPAQMRFLREAAIEHDNLLSDRFATSMINQAHALAELLNMGYGTNDK